MAYKKQPVSDGLFLNLPICLTEIKEIWKTWPIYEMLSWSGIGSYGQVLLAESFQRSWKEKWAKESPKFIWREKLQQYWTVPATSYKCDIFVQPFNK